MTFTVIAATIRAMAQVMTLMPVLPKNCSIPAAKHKVSQSKVASTEAVASRDRESVRRHHVFDAEQSGFRDAEHEFAPPQPL
jgi:hypothetical protein